MVKVVSLFSILFFLTLGFTKVWALPPCPSDTNAIWDNCFGTYIFGMDTEWAGDKYVGEWKDDKSHGQGTYTYANGDKYVGKYQDGKRHGQGTYTFASGNQYVGEYQDGKMDGQGTFTWADGDKYVGEFKDDKKNGQGTYTFADGAKYEGEYKEGLMSGEGTYTFVDGSKWVGAWENDNLNGYAIQYNSDGTIRREGIFKDNEFVYTETREKKEPSKLDKYKSTCEELGFTPGTEKFGDCVMKLMD